LRARIRALAFAELPAGITPASADMAEQQQAEDQE